jgi:adenylate kinase
MTTIIRGPRLVLLGRQGSGKGTQAERLVAHLGMSHLSTGTILRQEVASGTPLGSHVKELLDEGQLVPDAIMLEVVEAQLHDPEVQRRGFLLDGFPRTRAQAGGLLELLGPHGLDAALHLDVPTAVVRRRLASRRVCTRCDAPTTARNREHTVYCQKCGGTAVRRPDDTPEAIDRRLALYEAEAASLLQFFEKQGLLVNIDAVVPPDAVFESLLHSLRPMLWGTGEAVG